MQIFKKIALSCCLLIMVVLTGCGASKEATLVGKWKVRYSKNPNTNAARGKELKAITLEFKEDKTYALNLGMPMEGSWTMDDAGKVSMNITKAMGQNLRAPINAKNSPVAQLNTDDTTLTLQLPHLLHPEKAAENALVFEKE